MLTQDVERMPYALCLIVLGIWVGESTLKDFKNAKNENSYFLNPEHV